MHCIIYIYPTIPSLMTCVQSMNIYTTLNVLYIRTRLNTKGIVYIQVLQNMAIVSQHYTSLELNTLTFISRSSKGKLWTCGFGKGRGGTYLGHWWKGWHQLFIPTWHASIVHVMMIIVWPDLPIIFFSCNRIATLHPNIVLSQHMIVECQLHYLV